MAARGAELEPVWDDIDRAVGQMFMAGFDSTSVTPQIKEIIEKYHVGNILLTAKNLVSAEQTTQLVYDLQKIAHDAGHTVCVRVGELLEGYSQLTTLGSTVDWY